MNWQLFKTDENYRNGKMVGAVMAGVGKNGRAFRLVTGEIVRFNFDGSYTWVF